MGPEHARLMAQTHHRGQVHCLLTASGARPGDTDLFLMPEEARSAGAT